MAEQQASSSNQIPAAFHRKVIEEMGGQQPVLVFEKVLESGDVGIPMGALSLDERSNNLMAALTPLERSKVHNEVGITPGFLTIVATDPSGKEFLFYLEKWPMEKTVLLARDWLPFVQTNKLKKGDTVQGWGYRLTDPDRAGQFCLALNFFKKPR